MKTTKRNETKRKRQKKMGNACLYLQVKTYKYVKLPLLLRSFTQTLRAKAEKGGERRQAEREEKATVGPPPKSPPLNLAPYLPVCIASAVYQERDQESRGISLISLISHTTYQQQTVSVHSPEQPSHRQQQS
jgi:hypothetical protein